MKHRTGVFRRQTQVQSGIVIRQIQRDVRTFTHPFVRIGGIDFQLVDGIFSVPLARILMSGE